MTPSEALASLPLLSFLTPEVRELVVASFVPVSFAYGDAVFAEGDVADAMFVIVEGRARVLKDGPAGEVSLNLLGPGDSFGETALLTGEPRTATVRASSPLDALRLDAGVFRALVARDPRIADAVRIAMRRHALGDLLRLSSPFARLAGDAMAALLRSLEPVAVVAGETICREGEPTNDMHIVEEGRMRVSRAGGDVAVIGPGDVVGERALLTGEAATATVVAEVDGKTLRLDRAAFDKLVAADPALRDDIASRVAQYDYRRHARVPLDVSEELLPAAAAAEDVASFEGEAATERRRRIRTFPVVRQVDEADCGAAALAMVCRHFGARVSLARIRNAVGTGIDGTSLRGLARGAESVGLAARALKVSRRNTDAMPLPAVVHWKGNHWVVLFDLDDTTARIADPASGTRRIPRAELEEAWSGYAVLFSPTDRLDEAPAAPSGFAWLRPFLRRHWRSFAGAAVLAMVVSALQLALPVLLGVVVDRVLPRRDFDLLQVLVLSMAAVFVVSVAASYAQRLILSTTAVRMDAETLDHVAGRMLALPMRYFYARRTGDLQRSLIGMRQVRQFLVQHSVSAITALVQLVVAVTLMFATSVVLALLFLAAAPAYALLMRFAVRRIRPLADSLEEAFTAYHSLQVDAVKGIETVKAIGGEDALRRAMVREYGALSDRQLKSDRATMAYDGAVQALTFVSLVGFVWIGSLRVLDGSLTIGGLVSFSTLLVLANGPIVALLALWDDMQVASVLLSRLSDIFEEEPEQGEDRSRLQPVPVLEGRVRLANVGFRYGGPDSPEIISGITVDVPAGTTVAIVGRSGSGKTTLVKCLAGLVEPTEGAVFYDGVDMRGLDYRQLRRHIGVVLQESFLFADTIARNISFGDDAPDMERVVRAATIAGAHDFIVRLPLGYDTKVGETGLLLSGGQRQRVAIARAVYHEPPILLFDEATSSLDTEAERAVQENLDRLLDRRTSFVIAHRLSTIRNADLILVLERGRLVEQGTHAELMAAKGLYFYLSSQQLDL